MNIDLSKEFDREYSSWRWAKRRELILFLAKAIFGVSAVALLTWEFIAVFFGFFTTNF